MSRRALEQMMAKWGQAAGVPNCVPHRFRHSFGTLLLRKTKNLKLVQEGLGHPDISSTVIYTQVAASEVEHGINQLLGSNNLKGAQQ